MPLFEAADPRPLYTDLQARVTLLYRNINKVVCLTKNMLFSSDPEWGE